MFSIAVSIAITFTITVVLTVLAVAVVITVFSLFQVHTVDYGTKLRQLLLNSQLIDQCIFGFMSIVSSYY